MSSHHVVLGRVRFKRFLEKLKCDVRYLASRPKHSQNIRKTFAKHSQNIRQNIRNVALLNCDKKSSVARFARQKLQETRNQERLDAKVFCYRTGDYKFNFMETEGFGTVDKFAISAMNGAIITINPYDRQFASTLRYLRWVTSSKKPAILVLNTAQLVGNDVDLLTQSISSQVAKLIPLQGVLPEYHPHFLFKDDWRKGMYYDRLSANELLRRRLHLQETLAEIDDHFSLAIGKDDGADEKSFLASFVRVFQNALAVPVLYDWPLGVEGVTKLIPFLLPPPSDPDSEDEATQILSLNTTCVSDGGATCMVKVTGTLKRGDLLVNSRNHRLERIGNIFSVDGKMLHPLSALRHGDVGLVEGFTETKCGDILSSGEPLKCRKSPFPPISRCFTPLFKTTFQLPGRDVSKSLHRLRLEDPQLEFSTCENKTVTLSYSFDEQKKRVREELGGGLPPSPFGPSFVILKEVPRPSYGRVPLPCGVVSIDDAGVRFSIEMESMNGDGNEGNVIRFAALCHFTCEREIIDDIRLGISRALDAGPVLGHPVDGVKVFVKKVEVGGGKPSGELSSRVATKISKMLRRCSGVFRIHEPLLRLEITIPGAFLAQIEADLIRRGGAFTGATDDPLSDDIIVFATLPLQRQSSKGYRQSLTELSRGSAICYAELDQFAPEDIFENNGLSTYEEFLLTPILDLGVSELKAFGKLGHRLLPFEGGHDPGGGGDSPCKDTNNAIDFDDFYQYRKMMSHCLLHEVAANIAKDYSEQSPSKPKVAMELVGFKAKHRTLVDVTVKVPKATLLASATDEAGHKRLKRLTKPTEPSIGLIAISEEIGEGLFHAVEMDHVDEDDYNDHGGDNNDRRVLAVISSVHEEGDDYIFDMYVRRSNFPPGSSWLRGARVWLEYQQISFLSSFRRQLDTLVALKTSPLCDFVIRPDPSYLGPPGKDILSFDGEATEFSYNESQKLAINATVAMVNSHRSNGPRISLIHGPPGTGKSRVILGIIARLLGGREKGTDGDGSRSSVEGVSGARTGANHRDRTTLLNMRRRREGGGIMLCAPSNIAVDQLLVRVEKLVELSDFEAKIIRCGDKVDRRIQHLKPTGSRSEFKRALIDADILACTLSSDVVKRAKNVRCLIVDDASRASELESIAPMVNFSIGKIVLVGDHLQLPPFVLSKVAERQFYNRSLFERIYRACGEDDSGTAGSIFLNTQYRMHPEIAFFPSYYVYRGKLLSHHEEDDSSHFASPLLFFDVARGRESACGEFPGSWHNAIEMDAMARIAKALRSSFSSPYAFSIGVITPHRSQQMFPRWLNLNEEENRDSHKEEEKEDFNGVLSATATAASTAADRLRVKTVEEIQGGQKDYIIFSAVRAGSDQIGYQFNLKRLNVALTRAKRGLYIVGNASTLGTDPHWKALIKDVKERGKFVTVANLDEIDRFFPQSV